jgi:hypothetical protein
MKSIESDKQQLITLCKNEYENNDTLLALIDEFEVLFMIGRIFRLINMHRNNIEQNWEIRMKLSGDD